MGCIGSCRFPLCIGCFRVILEMQWDAIVYRLYAITSRAINSGITVFDLPSASAVAPPLSVFGAAFGS